MAMRAYERLCTAMHGYAARHGTAVQGYVQLMYGYIRLFTAMHASFRLCRAMHGFARLCTLMYGYVRPCMALHGMVRLFKAM